MKYLSLLLLLAVGTVELHAQKPKEVRVKFTYDIFPGQETKRIKLTCKIPIHIPKRQEVAAITYSVLPDSIIHEAGNTYAVFLINKPEREKLIIEATLHLYKGDYKTTKRHRGEYTEGLPADSVDYYLRPEKWIETEDPRIIAQATPLNAGEDTLTTLWNIHSSAKESFPYRRQEMHLGAARALTVHQGDCSEYADLFVALCRINHIPARVVCGFVVKREGDIGWHAWSEAFVHSYGWIPFDATGYNASFRSMDNKYVYLSRSINDSRLVHGHYFSYRSYGAAAKILRKVEIE
jgi:hypothetical protein